MNLYGICGDRGSRRKLDNSDSYIFFVFEFALITRVAVSLRHKFLTYMDSIIGRRLGLCVICQLRTGDTYKVFNRIIIIKTVTTRRQNHASLSIIVLEYLSK